MKKAIALLLALALVGGAVFAQDAALEVAGYVSSGVKIVNSPAATTFQNYNYDWGAAGTSAYIDVSYTGEMAGADVTAYADTTGSFSIDTAYGWISPMAGLKLIAGNWYGGAFDGVDDDSNDYFAKEGLFATYGMSGFTAGAGFSAATAASEDLDYVFGVAYALDGVVKARVSAQTVAADLNKMSVSASLLMVPGLPLTAGYLSESMATTANSWVDLTVGYKISDALSAKVVVYDYLDKEYLTIGPRVSYTVSDALSVYGQVTIVTEDAAVADSATIKPRVYAAYKADIGKFVAQVEYNTLAETTTAYLSYVWSF